MSISFNATSTPDNGFVSSASNFYINVDVSGYFSSSVAASGKFFFIWGQANKAVSDAFSRTDYTDGTTMWNSANYSMVWDALTTSWQPGFGGGFSLVQGEDYFIDMPMTLDGSYILSGTLDVTPLIGSPNSFEVFILSNSATSFAGNLNYLKSSYNNSTANYSFSIPGTTISRTAYLGYWPFTLNESIKVSDNVRGIISGKTHSGNVALSGSLTKSSSRILTENITLADNKGYGWTLKETLKIDDGDPPKEVISKVLTEQIQLNDSYGKPDQLFVYVYDTTSASWVEVEGVEYFKVEKRLNQMSKFTMSLPQIETAQKLYVKEYAKVMLFSNNSLILKGRIQKVTYETSYSCQIEGFGMEAVILDKEYKNFTRSPTDEDRVQYTNESAQLIAKELLSANADGAAPWTMQPRTYGLFATDYGDISMRFEYANKLTALGKLADAIKYDWWVDHDPISYTNDYFNIASIKGNQTAPDASRTFTITGTTANAEGTDYQRDVTNIANYVKIIGYGDGINQLFTSTYNASPIWTTLSADISSTDATIPLIDSSAFPASGTVRIAGEIITYTGNAANQLTGCTRGTSSTDKKMHRKNCYIEKYVVSTSPEANSSISENGLMELTLSYREVRDEATLELIASNELIDRMNPIERITLTPSEPQTVAETLHTGDLINIVDAESSLNSNYRIVALIYENNYGSLSMSMEASNKSLTFIEQMQKEREKNQNLQKYMQGATNVYVVSNSENCDTNFGCVIKTYIPVDAIAINHVKLSYQVLPYRIYNTTTKEESPPHTHSLAISTEPTDGRVLAAIAWNGTTLYSGFGGGTTATTAGSPHQHGANYAISEPGNTVSVIQVLIDNVDKTAEVIAASGHGPPLSIVQEQDIDIQSLITTTGWHTIEVRPTGTCRISVDAWLQVFIESK